MSRLLGLYGFLIVFWLWSGCSAMDSGPKLMREVSAGTMAIGTTLASQMAPKNLTASAGGEVHNPEYQCNGFVGSGVAWNMTLRLIGAELDFDIAGAGEGKLEPDDEILALIADIQSRRGLTESQQNSLIATVIAEWIASKTVKPQGEPDAGGGGDADTVDDADTSDDAASPTTAPGDDTPAADSTPSDASQGRSAASPDAPDDLEAQNARVEAAQRGIDARKAQREDAALRKFTEIVSQRASESVHH